MVRQKQKKLIAPAWWKTFFNADYFLTHERAFSAGRLSLETRFLRAAAASLRRPLPVALDLGCGHGRHLSAWQDFARPVVGVDVSATALDVARRATPGPGVFPVRADIRRLPLASASVDFAYCLYNSFGYFSDADNDAALAEAARVLNHGGLLLLDVLNRSWLRRNLRPVSVERFPRARVTYRRRFDGKFLILERSLRAGSARRVARSRVRLYTLAELARLLRRHGLAVAETYSDFLRAPLRPWSKQILLLARKT